MKALLYKEALAARPYLALALLYGLIGFASYLARTDVLGGLATNFGPDSGAGLLVTGCIVFAVGHAQTAPEVTQGHMEFLDGLPVGRLQIFTAKLAVGLVYIALILFVEVVVEVTFSELAFDAQSLSTLATVARGRAAGLLAFYCTGLVLSWLGGYGWILLGLGITVISTIAEFSDTLRPMSLLHGYAAVRFEANTPQSLDWPQLLWALYGVGAAAVSGVLFLGPGDALVKTGSQLLPALRVASIILVSSLLALAACGSLLQLPSEEGSAVQVVQAGRFRVMTSTTTNPAQDDLLRRMPAIDEAVRQLMQVPTAEPLLDVELLGGGRYHAGVYTGGKIRMALTRDPPHTFAHELAHAYAHTIAGERVHRHMDALRFFNEGLAMWSAERVIEGSEASNDPFRQWAGAIYQMGHHHLDLLMQDKLRSREHDQFEPYPLGFVFVEALVEIYGDPVVPCLIRQTSALPARDLDGSAIWSLLAHGCDVDLGLVVRAYERRLSKYAAGWPTTARVWTGRPAVLHGDEVIRVEPLPSSAGDLRRVCRLRSRPEAKVADLQELRVDADSTCPIRVRDGTTETVWFQVGLRLSLGWTAYGPWLAAPNPR